MVTNRSQVNILLVDDQPANLLAMQTVLGGLNENIICANSGEEALRAVLQFDFAVILLDVRMPTMNGFETARLIRSRPRSSTVAILFITASLEPGFSIEEAYALGAVDFLTKPLLPTVLQAKVSFFVELYRKTEELARIERAKYVAELTAKDERIRLILDNAKDFAFVGMNVDGYITEWEGGATLITGWTAEEALGRSMEFIFTPEDHATKIFEIELHRARQAGRAEDKRWHSGKNGKKFFADGVMVALRDDTGNMRGFAKIFRDATAERLATENFRISEQRFSLLVNSAGEGVCSVAPDTSCTFINVTGAELLGYKPAELIGRPIHDIIHRHQADDSPYSIDECQIARAARDGEAIRVHDEVFWRKDGTMLPVSYSVSPMVVDGKADGAVVTFMDITERKRVEDDLRKVAAELSEVDRRKTEFLATLAHELRNPLAALSNGLQVMQLAAEPATIARAGEIMSRQMLLLVHLVNDLLDIARISYGNIELKKERIELRSIVDGAVETSTPLIVAGRHTLHLHIPDEPLSLEVDPTRITQVLSNLLNNAAKYTPEGGEITLSAWCHEDDVQIAIKDNGIGIPEASLQIVFDMFTQLKQNGYTAQVGLGIGLTLVRRLIELHGGTVSASSPGPGQGSTFNVRLPRMDRRVGESKAPADRPNDDVDANVPVLRVLIVDDNADAAETLSSMLRIRGHTTYVAHDGIEAIKMAQETIPDVIFLDIGMPIMNGYEVARALRNLPDTKHIVLVALTGWGTESDRMRSKDAGFDEHLTKPIGLSSVSTFFEKLQLHKNKT